MGKYITYKNVKNILSSTSLNFLKNSPEIFNVNFNNVSAIITEDINLYLHLELLIKNKVISANYLIYIVDNKEGYYNQYDEHDNRIYQNINGVEYYYVFDENCIDITNGYKPNLKYNLNKLQIIYK